MLEIELAGRCLLGRMITDTQRFAISDLAALAVLPVICHTLMLSYWVEVLQSDVKQKIASEAVMVACVILAASAHRYCVQMNRAAQLAS